MTKTVKFVSIQQVGWSYNGGFYINGIFGIFDILVTRDKYRVILEFEGHKHKYPRVTDFITRELKKAVDNKFYC